MAPLDSAGDEREARRIQYHECEALVVGAGIMGSALAVALGQQGRSVILLERSLKEPDRIVGELLQPGGVAALEKLGLRNCLEDIDAIPVQGYEVVYFGEGVPIPYPYLGYGKNALGSSGSEAYSSRTQGRSFHHGRFVQRLRQAALRTPNVTVVESEALSLVRNSHTGQVVGVTARTGPAKQPDYFFADQTFITDGHHSTFRKSSNYPNIPSHTSKFHALELHDCPLPSPQHGHVILGRNAPVLLYQIGAHETRALVDVPLDSPTASAAAGGVKSHLRNVVLPSLPPQVQPSFDEALARTEKRNENGEIIALKSMPNAYLAPAVNKFPGLMILGDALNMRHPLTGGGMTVALNDVVLLTSLLSPANVPTLADTEAVLQAARKFHWQRKGLTSVVNILAQALYALFAANDPNLRILQQGCFRYFQLGGECINGPVSLLAGLNWAPFILFYHFFSVALYSIWIYILEGNPTGDSTQRLMQNESLNLAQSNGSAKTHVNGHANGDAQKLAVPLKPKTSRRSFQNLIGMPWRVLHSFSIFWSACVVIFPYIFAELKT